MWWARASGNHGFRRSHGQEGAAHRSNRGLPASAPLARRLAHLQCWTTAQQRERTWGGSLIFANVVVDSPRDTFDEG